MTFGKQPSFEGVRNPGYVDRIGRLHAGYGALVAASMGMYPEKSNRVLIETGVIAAPQPELPTTENPAPAGPLMQATVEGPGA